jgi:hypothetical protein
MATDAIEFAKQQSAPGCEIYLGINEESLESGDDRM